MAKFKSSLLTSFDLNAFSVLYLNIRNMKKNLYLKKKNACFKNFLGNFNVNFNAICLSLA